MIKKSFALYMWAALFATVTFAQAAAKLKLDSLFAVFDANKKAMGSIAISKNGKMVYNKVIGYSLYNPDKKIPADERTKYRIGSITKLFTAVIIFQLIEEGKISLGSTLERYFPKIPNAKRIAIGNLLNHSSGIPNIKNVRAKWRPRTHQEMLNLISHQKGWTMPDTISSYSNSNFLLLGYIIEKITGKTYAEVLNERIVSKIGLTDTYFGDGSYIANNESFSYCLKRIWKEQHQTHPSIPGASGGIVSTPTNLVSFIEALFSNRLISQSSLEKMTTISYDNYGMGLFQYKLDNKKAFGHPGGIDRFESLVAYFPADSVAVAYCSNGQVYPVKDIIIAALNIYFGKEYVIPEFKPVVIKPHVLKKYEGVYRGEGVSVSITIKRHKKKLIAESAGHLPYELYPVSPDIFRCDEVSVIVEFDLSNSQMILYKEGKVFNFSKK